MHLEDVINSGYSYLRDMVVITRAEPFDVPGPQIVFVNDAFCEHTGYTQSEIIGKTPRIMHGPGTNPETRNRISTKLKAWKPVRETILNYKKNGQPFWVELQIVPISDENGWYHYWVSVQRDVTDQKVAQERLDLTIAASGAGIWDWNTETGHFFGSARFREILGLSKKNFPPHVNSFFECILEENRPKVQKALDDHFERRAPFEISFWMMHTDGQYVQINAKGQAAWGPDGKPVRMVGTISNVTDHMMASNDLIQAQDLSKTGHWSRGPNLNQVKVSQQAWSILGQSKVEDDPWKQFIKALGPDSERRLQEFIDKHPDRDSALRFSRVHDGKTQHVQIRVTVQELQNGFQYIFGTIEDCTHVVCQLDAVAASERLAACGQIAGGVAHDFNNLLAAISLGADRLAENISPQEHVEIIDDIQLAVSQGQDLTEALLNYTIQAPLKPEVFSLTEASEAIVGLVRRLLPSSMAVELNFEDNLPDVKLDRNGFDTSLMNLIVNARDACGSSGKIRVAAKQRKDGVSITVEDNGPGIPENLRQRVTEPFFSTKVKGKGTGIGLSRVYGFAQQSGGELVIGSSALGGACLTLNVPKSKT